MKLCSICTRPRPMWGWFNPHKPRDQREILWACSNSCLDYLMRKIEGEVCLEAEAVKAIELSLPDVGAYVAAIGMGKPLADYSRDEILGLIRASVEAYQANMQKLVVDDLSGDEVPL